MGKTNQRSAVVVAGLSARNGKLITPSFKAVP